MPFLIWAYNPCVSAKRAYALLYSIPEFCKHLERVSRVLGRNSKTPTLNTGVFSSITKIFVLFSIATIATVYKGNIIKNLIMDCQSYTKYRPNETTGGIFVSWRRKEELPTGA